MLPRVKIIFENGLIGSSSPMGDGVCGFVCTGVAVANKLELNNPYLITQYGALEDFGVSSESSDLNATLHKFVKEFYDIAPQGSKLYFMCVANTVKVSDMVNKTKEYGKKLIEYSKGDIRMLFACKQNSGVPTILDGLDNDVISGQYHDRYTCT